MLALPGFTQVTVSGSVENNGKRLDKATIRIYEDGKFDRTVNANNSFPRKGNFSFTLDVNHDYLIVLYRPFMVPRKIAIATYIHEKVLAENEEGVFLDFGPIPVFENF
ncbi:MAG: hypothetical protein AAGB22_12815, partial [Bacteroidota bacterium]